MTNNTLIAIMNSKADFEIAVHESWYRIPVDTTAVPQIVRQKKVQYIAFYHTQVFPQEKFSIRYFAQVNKIRTVKRKKLLAPPDHPLKRLEYDTKADKDYYKIEFSPLHPLVQPIISKKHRRILFIPTTDWKLFNAPEINFLFNDSPLEESLWLTFVARNIPAERQYLISALNQNFLLDFAIFCRERNINIECDGDQHHTMRKDVYADKTRNNLLESAGWAVLRFTPPAIYDGIDDTLWLINETINRYGGVESDDRNDFNYIRKDNDPQLRLFEPESSFGSDTSPGR